SFEWKPPLQGQYGAALQMLANAIRACPDEVWVDRRVSVAHQYWYLAFHTLFWNDYYMEQRERDFVPPAPFTMGEADPTGVYPAEPYSHDTLLAYLEHSRERVRARIAGLSDAAAAAPCGFERRELSLHELLLYNLRHVQHHTAQLNLLLRQHGIVPPGW